MIRCLEGIREVVGGDILSTQCTEVLNELAIILTHEDERVAFLANQLVNLAIVIAFVRATENQYGRGGHALQRVPAGIDVGGLGVIDVLVTYGNIKRPMSLNQLVNVLRSKHFIADRRGTPARRGWIVYERDGEEINAERKLLAKTKNADIADIY